MSNKKIVDKIKHFWDDSEAISPIIATIMVLVVAVAAGAGLYFWFDTFQTGAQEEVGESATGSMRSMVIGSADIAINLMDEKFSLEGMDATDDTSTDNIKGNGRISWAQDYISGPVGLNGKRGVAWMDERFIVEIPITVSSSAALENVKIFAGVPSVVSGGESNLRAYHWLHLDRNNGYQLLKGDGTPFKGFINDSTDKVYEDNTDGYTYYFGRSGLAAGIDILNGNLSAETGTLANNTSTSGDESQVWGAKISGTNGGLMVMSLYTNTASQERYFAFAKNGSEELGWITCDYTNGGRDKYFNGIDKINGMFHGNTYEVADELTPNKAVTVSTYFMVSTLMLDKGQDTLEDDGMAEIVLPYTITTDEGLIEKTSVTLIIKD